MPSRLQAVYQSLIRRDRQFPRKRSGVLTRRALGFLLTRAGQHGITHAFVVEFTSAADRDYYVREDPTHLAFVQTLKALIEKSQVIDFTNGRFGN